MFELSNAHCVNDLEETIDSYSIFAILNYDSISAGVKPAQLLKQDRQQGCPARHAPSMRSRSE